jgi:predicted lactoylglutathione lyase
MFVNMAVKDLDQSKSFYEALGFTINPQFTDHNAACVVVDDGHIYFMIHTREYFQTFTELTIGDPAVNPTSSVAIFVDSKDAVNAAVEAGLAAGGTEPGEPSDYGFMYQRGLTDPSGNVIDFGWMDPVAAAQGPEAFAEQQG